MAHAADAFPKTPLPRVRPDRDPGATVKSLPIEAPHKLITPRLDRTTFNLAPRRLRGERPLSAPERAAGDPRRARATAGTAEALFLQKQMQMRTPLVFVLEDGEQVQGVVEWYDQNSIKIRNQTRVLLYNRAIKYLHKVTDSLT